MPRRRVQYSAPGLDATLGDASSAHFLAMELRHRPARALLVERRRGPEKTIGSLGLDDRPAVDPFPNLRLSLSPDGKSLAYSTLKETRNLWLMDGLDSVTPR